MHNFISSKPAKAIGFALALAPLVLLLWNAFTDQLTANPVEYVTRHTGTWTLRFLLITLAITPLRRYLRVPELIRFRRMLGLFAFSYGSLHLLTYVWLDQFFDVLQIARDIAKRPFITAGFAGFLAMVPLAVTSTTAWIRRLGGKRWQFLHRLVYLSAAAGVVHYYWLVKSDVRIPLLYGILLAVALSARVPIWLGRFKAS